MDSVATIKDVAALAGVRDATVSRTFSGKAPVAEKTRQRVIEAAKLGYRPSVAARAIRTGRTGYVGIIRSNIISFSVHDPAFEFGVDEALHEHERCLLRDIIDDQAELWPRASSGKTASTAC